MKVTPAFFRLRMVSVGVIAALGVLGPRAGTAQEGAKSGSASIVAETVRNLLSESSQDLADGDYELAIRDASTAIQLDPHNASAYELRGAIYIEEKLWDRAERDYTTAERYSPDAVYKYKLADIRFLAKAYEDAQPRFAALESDAHLGDLATYKAFLCDLLGYHENAALRDLAALDRGVHGPAYYYSHAAWDLYHANLPEARKYLGSAQQLFDRSTCGLYYSILVESRRFNPESAHFTTKDGTPYDNVSVLLENDGLRVSTPKHWLTVPLDQLPDDLSGFPEDLREQIDRRRAVLPDAHAPISLVSFTTRSGRDYERVRWAMADAGLSVLTDEGWVVVPFTELPANPSSLPDELRQALQEREALPGLEANRTEIVSFTTSQGKRYSEAKVILSDEGLRVLTADGWITVPFQDLPRDVSAFPSGWQPQIEAGRKARRADPSGMEVISFTTRKGKRYDQVRTALGRSGLQLVTSEGWVEVPFSELPHDVSVFPEEWRETIVAREMEPAKDRVPAH